jgi:hypothetical protein
MASVEDFEVRNPAAGGDHGIAVIIASAARRFGKDTGTNGNRDRFAGPRSAAQTGAFDPQELMPPVA